MSDRIIKSKIDGHLYEVEHVSEDAFGCRRLSAYDGMPIGPIVYIAKGDIDGHAPTNAPVKEAR